MRRWASMYPPISRAPTLPSSHLSTTSSCSMCFLNSERMILNWLNSLKWRIWLVSLQRMRSMRAISCQRLCRQLAMLSSIVLFLLSWQNCHMSGNFNVSLSEFKFLRVCAIVRTSHFPTITIKPLQSKNNHKSTCKQSAHPWFFLADSDDLACFVYNGIDSGSMAQSECHCCGKVPQSILVLSCEHLICLKCAAKEVEGQLKQWKVVCSKCRITTHLEAELVEEIKQFVSEKQPQQASSKQIHQEEFPLERVCSTHPDFALMYLCNTCPSTLLCPQCIIRGTHQNHSVTPLTTAAQQIREHISQQLSNTNSHIEHLRSENQTRTAQLASRGNELHGLKVNAEEEYAKLRDQLQREEARVLARCSELMVEHRGQVEAWRREFDEQMNSWEQYREELNTVVHPLMEEARHRGNKVWERVKVVEMVEKYHRLKQKVERKKNRQRKWGQKVVLEGEDAYRSLRQRVQNISSGWKMEQAKHINRIEPTKQRTIHPTPAEGIKLTRDYDKENNEQPARLIFHNKPAIQTSPITGSVRTKMPLFQSIPVQAKVPPPPQQPQPEDYFQLI